MKALIASSSLALSLLVAAAGAAQAAPVLSLTTANASVPYGSPFTIAVGIADVSDLFGYNLSLAFDPGKFQFLSVSEGSFLSNAGSTFFIPGLDDGSGTVAFSGAALIGAIGGASGGGNLLNFTFASTSPGAALFTLSDLLFIDSALAPIAVGGASLGVVVQAGPLAVPEPASLALVLAGMAALAARRTARRAGASHEVAGA